jgi:hypothetical protein
MEGGWIRRQRGRGLISFATSYLLLYWKNRIFSFVPPIICVLHLPADRLKLLVQVPPVQVAYKFKVQVLLQLGAFYVSLLLVACDTRF